MKRIMGVVYALPDFILDNIFNKKKNVFVKFLPWEPTKKSKLQLKPGVSIYFYKSNSNKVIVGRATIKSVGFYLYPDLLKQYGPKLMLSSPQLRKYSLGRETKKLLTLELSKIFRLKEPVLLKKSINMGGLYLTKENYNFYLSESKLPCLFL